MEKEFSPEIFDSMTTTFLAVEKVPFPLHWYARVLFYFQILSSTRECSSVDQPYCVHSSNLHDLLDTHAANNHNDFCLSYVFTYQHLTDSTLGLAWTANSYKGT